MAYDKIFQFRIALLAIEPPIWRRIQVPGTMALSRLHRVFQVVMGTPFDEALWELQTRCENYVQTKGLAKYLVGRSGGINVSVQRMPG